jgi:hypothetical protein
MNDTPPGIGGINWASPGAEPKHATRATWASSDDWLVVATLANGSVADVRAFAVWGMDADGGGAVLYEFDGDGSIYGTPDVSDAIVQLTGHVKWDGCSNLTIGEPDCMMHFCGPAAASMRDLLAMVYATARVAPGDAWQGEADDTEPAVVVHRWEAPHV